MKLKGEMVIEQPIRIRCSGDSSGDEHDHGGSEQYSGAESHGDLSESQRGV